MFEIIWDWEKRHEHRDPFSVWNACTVPRTYKIPAIKTYKNVKDRKKHDTLFLTTHKHVWTHKIHSVLSAFPKKPDIPGMYSGNTTTALHSANDTVAQGCKNPARRVARPTEFCKVAPYIFSIISAVLVSRHKDVCISTHAPHTKRQTATRFTGHSRSEGPQYGTCST